MYGLRIVGTDSREGAGYSLSRAAGTGKSLTAEEVCARTGMRHVDVGRLAKEHDLFDGWDEKYQCPVLHDDKVSPNGLPRL